MSSGNGAIGVFHLMCLCVFYLPRLMFMHGGCGCPISTHCLGGLNRVSFMSVASALDPCDQLCTHSFECSL